MCDKKKTSAESVRNRTGFKVISSGCSMSLQHIRAHTWLVPIRGEGK